jgi:predicted Zn-dependent protease
MTRHYLLPTAVNSWSSRGPTLARSRSSISLVAAAAGALLIAACATNPATGKREISLMSEAQEIQLGREADVQVQREMGLYEDRALQEYVNDVGQRLARGSHRPNLPWHFAVVDAAAVNAFALPGGYIYLTRGIMAYLNDEAELAGVLGHEIGHVTARHAAQAYTRSTGAGLGLLIGSIFVPQVGAFGNLAQTGLGILFLKYGRDQELQADRLGAEYAADNMWDPAAVPEFLGTLARIDEQADRRGVPNWLSTHPNPADRAEDMQKTIAELKASRSKGSWEVDREGYLRRIEGIVFGENPREGIVRGNSFLHPDLRFGLEFPKGWEIANGKEQVVAKMPGQNAFVMLQLVPMAQGRSMEEIATRSTRNIGLREVSGGTTTINGLEAYLGTYEGSLNQVGTVAMRAAHVRQGRTVYLVAAFAPPQLYEQLERDLAASVRSFRALSRDEAQNIEPNRVTLYTVERGDTWQSIAQRRGGDNVTAATLAIMNSSAVSDQPRPGETIKIVVAGNDSEDRSSRILRR